MTLRLRGGVFRLIADPDELPPPGALGGRVGMSAWLRLDCVNHSRAPLLVDGTGLASEDVGIAQAQLGSGNLPSLVIPERHFFSTHERHDVCPWTAQGPGRCELALNLEVGAPIGIRDIGQVRVNVKVR